MKTLNLVVAFMVACVLSVVSFGCADSDSPTAPSSTVPVPVASSDVNGVPAAGGATLQPASFDLQPGTGQDEHSFNAYDFDASYDGSVLNLILIEDEMTGMREASKPHRNRMITVEICPSEPHHAMQTCGDPIWKGSMMLSGRLELPDIPLASCEGWIVVHAAELSDDKYDGWRNSPCPAPDGETVVSSDGTGEGWPEYPEPEPTPNLPISLSDPTDDLDWARFTREGSWVDADYGSRRSTDLIKLNLSEQDSDGWIRVTFTLDAELDATMHRWVKFELHIHPMATRDDEFFSWRAFTGDPNVPGYSRERWTLLDSFHEPDDPDYSTNIRPVSTNLRGSTFSFDILPPSELRGIPLHPPLRVIDPDICCNLYLFGGSITVETKDADDAFGLNFVSSDYIALPDPFLLPEIP